MKFCFFGYDHTLDIAQRLVAEGHTLLQIFTFPCDNQFVFNTQTTNFGSQNKIAVNEEKITPKDVKKLLKKGCEFFISAGYPHKIPPIDENQAYAFNLHPALLPLVRGIMPAPYIIMKEPDAAGFTIHKMTQDYDAGDILLQKPIKLEPTDDIEILSSKIAIHTPDAVLTVVNNIEKFWKEAKPQDHSKATEYQEPDEEFRTLKWSEPYEVLSKKIRAFGRFGLIATISNNMGQSQKLAVYNSVAWKEKHEYAAGTLLRSKPREIVIAISDGYICLKEFQVIG